MHVCVPLTLVGFWHPSLANEPGKDFRRGPFHMFLSHFPGTAACVLAGPLRDVVTCHISLVTGGLRDPLFIALSRAQAWGCWLAPRTAVARGHISDLGALWWHQRHCKITLFILKSKKKTERLGRKGNELKEICSVGIAHF